MDNNSAGARLDEIAKEIQASRRVGYSQALHIAQAENPDLARAYSNVRGEGSQSSSSRRSYSVVADAGDKLDKRAKSIIARGGSNYRDALTQAGREMPRALSAWGSGVLNVKDYDMLSECDQKMTRALSDPDWIRQLAGSLLDHHAQALAGSNQRGGQVDPESYRSALQSLTAQFPDLAAAADTGTIDSSNWALLATLVPSISSEVKSKFGVDPYNLRAGNYSRSRRTYRDNNGNEVRKYVL
jgi:hypothetical protein